jgi:SEC-C motif
MTEDPPRRHQVGFAAILIPDSGINRLRFSACEDLLDEGARLVDETGRTPIGGAKLLLAVQATRATHSFESVIALCKIGRGVQAAMINRSLLEDALDVHWVAANPDTAPALADDHERLILLGERAVMTGFGREDVGPLDAHEGKELARLVKVYDGFRRSWTLATDEARVALIKERWAEHPGADGFIDQTYEVIQRQNNTLLHSSPTAVAIAMSPGRRGPNRVGPDMWWREALRHGALAYYFVCKVIAEEFGLSKEPVADVFFRASCFTKLLDAAQIEGLGENDSCPCGSGRALGKCHDS